MQTLGFLSYFCLKGGGKMRDCKHNIIMLPPNYNCFTICTKNPANTINRVLVKTGIIAVNLKNDLGYFYLNIDDLEELKKGNTITVITTLNPFNNCNNVLEAWGKAKITPGDLGLNSN